MTTEVLITNATYGTPSGNYDGSSQDWISVAGKAANYYRGRGSVQTIDTEFTGFVGICTIEATLDSDPDNATWFGVDLVFGDGSTVLTQSRSDAVLGNFTWIRARVDNFTAGTIVGVAIFF
jgi:Zn-dependent metalloprotease